MRPEAIWTPSGAICRLVCVWSCCSSVPSAVGLVILAEPIARLLFERGQFTAADTLRAARMIAVYGSAVWAYCSLPVLIRGFYAVGDRVTPLRMALAAVALNLALDLTLIWPLAEVGLAAATAISAVLQAAVLALLFSRRHARPMWRTMGATAAKTVVASAAMAAVGLWVLRGIPDSTGHLERLATGVRPVGGVSGDLCGSAGSRLVAQNGAICSGDDNLFTVAR